MPETMWYCAKGGQRLGPFSLDQLQQMAAAGVIAPGDQVMRDGDAGWTDISAVPELLSPPPPPVTAGSPLVSCEKCQAKISDIAERCPQCGHPQAPLEAKEQGEELYPCPQCNTTNQARCRFSFRYGSRCRGCDRPLKELYPQVLFEAEVDDVYRSFTCLTESDLGGAIPWAGAVCGGLAALGLTSFIFPTCIVVIALLIGGLAGLKGAFPLFSYVYWRLFVRGKPLPCGRTISNDDWRSAEFREEQEERRKAARLQAAQSQAKPSSGSNWLNWIFGVAVVGCLLFAWLRFDQAQSEKNQLDHETKIGSTMAAAITISKDEGNFSHDLILTNESPSPFGTCDLTLTVYLTTGKQQPVRQYWSTWGSKEQKKVNIPAGGKVERVDVSGTMVNAAGNRGRLDTTFEWKPKPPQQPGGRP